MQLREELEVVCLLNINCREFVEEKLEKEGPYVLLSVIKMMLIWKIASIVKKYPGDLR